MDKLRVATVFSGIGAFEQALERLSVNYEIIFACDNGDRHIDKSKDEILNYAKKHNMNNSDLNNYVHELYDSTKKRNYVYDSYISNYKIKNNKWFDDIRFIDGKQFKNKVDIFVGGSPCQSFSMMGKRKGLNDVRGTLFYEYARLVKEIEPRFFIYENVPGMLNHDEGKTWDVIKSVFKSLNYHINYAVLNSKDYGIPQNRKRLFVVGTKNKNDIFNFPLPITLKKTAFDYLENHIDKKFYLGKKGFEFVTNPKNKGRARINQLIIRTQKANQQFNWNGDFIFEELNHLKHNNDILIRAYIGKYNGKIGVVRQLTNRECLRLMGFSDDFKIVVPSVQAYRQAGNSIVVDVLIAILKELLKNVQ